MRRSEFLGALAVLPVVGGLFKHYKPEPRPARETDTFFRAQSRVFKANYEREMKSWIDSDTGNFNHRTTFSIPWSYYTRDDA